MGISLAVSQNQGYYYSKPLWICLNQSALGSIEILSVKRTLTDLLSEGVVRGLILSTKLPGLTFDCDQDSRSLTSKVLSKIFSVSFHSVVGRPGHNVCSRTSKILTIISTIKIKLQKKKSLLHLITVEM